MTRNNLLSEASNYTGVSHTPTHLHFCTYNTEILEYHQGASIKEFSPFIRPDAINWVQIHGLQNTEIVQEVCDFFHIDFLTTQSLVDTDRLGILGICGFGGIALNNASMDTRVKASVITTMYDMTRYYAEWL